MNIKRKEITPNAKTVIPLADIINIYSKKSYVLSTGHGAD